MICNIVTKQANSISVLSANCQGLRNPDKKFDVITYYKESKASIMCLQDTHLTNNDISVIKRIWGGEVIVCGNKTNARGVAILLNSNFEYKIISKTEDPDGNFISLVMKLSSMTVNPITLYGPNNDHPDFFQCIQDTIQQTTTDYNIICGDFNLVLNPDIDTHNYNAINNPRAMQNVLTIMKNYHLCDVFRELHQNKKRFTWRRRNPVKQARLDFFLVSTSILDIVKKCDININYRSDHSTIELQLLLNNFIRGKGFWKFNNSLLENPNYLNLVNNIRRREITVCPASLSS